MLRNPKQWSLTPSNVYIFSLNKEIAAYKLLLEMLGIQAVKQMSAVVFYKYDLGLVSLLLEYLWLL